MKKFLSTLCASALTASVAATSVLPASAAPVFVPKAPAVHSDVIQIRNTWKRRYGNNNNFRGKNWNGNGHIIITTAATITMTSGIRQVHLSPGL